MSQMSTFRASVEKIGGEDGWHIVRLPNDIVTKLREQSAKKGNLPVVCQIGKTKWTSTSMSMGEQQWFVAVKASIRTAENLKVGDRVEVTIQPDAARLKK